MNTTSPIRSRSLAGAVGAAALLVLTACAVPTATVDDDPDTLVFGVIPYENADTLDTEYAPLVDLLAEETGKEVDFQVLTDYSGLIEGQRAGTVHLAMYGPFSYVLAADSGAGVIPVGVQLYEREADPSYQSYMVVREDSGIDELTDLRDRNVCFVDPNSTSGRLYPLAGLTKVGLDEDDYTTTFAGGHDASLLAVRDGDCDAGAARDLMFYELLPEQEEFDPDDFEVIWKSDPIVGSPLAVSDSLNDELIDTITTAVVRRGNADHLGVDAIAGFWGFAEVSDEVYDPIREICAITRAEVCETG